ncbi:MAG: ATP-binding protein [Ruegeria sp.]
MNRINDRQNLEVTFAATKAEASAGIATLSERLGMLGLPETKSDDVRIALAEAVNNVVEHAYAGTTPENVHVKCALGVKNLEILITDPGVPMPDFALGSRVPASVETVLADLPEGGFGWYLIRTLTSDVRYERRAGCNRLSLLFEFAEPS